MALIMHNVLGTQGKNPTCFLSFALLAGTFRYSFQTSAHSVIVLVLQAKIASRRAQLYAPSFAFSRGGNILVLDRAFDAVRTDVK